MAQTFMDKTKNGLVKKFHTLLGKAGVDNETKLILLSGYGVTTSLDMTVDQLVELCDTLDKMANPKIDELDKLRKRVMASIYGWRKALGCVTNEKEVKAIACRAAEIPEGYGINDRFNSIGKEKLTNLMHTFNNKTKILNNVETMTQEQIDKLITFN